MPSVIKATAIVNGDVITQTDIDQRAGAAGDRQRQRRSRRTRSTALRQQVLRNLIDETLQIQAAKTEKIDIKQSDIDRTVERVAANVKQTPEQLAAYLEANGSSIKIAAPPDRGRDRLAAAAARQDRKRRQRRRR